MKRIVILTLLMITGGIASAQSTQKTHKEEPSRPIKKNTHKIIKLNSMFFMDQDELSGYFKTGSIPSSFPGYNQALSSATNKQQVAKWLAEGINKETLTTEGLTKVLNYTEK